MPELQKDLRDKLKIPSFFLDRMYLQSSGFCGYDVWLAKNEEVDFYSIYRSAGKSQITAGLSLIRPQRIGPASLSSRRTTSSSRRGRSQRAFPTITIARAMGTLTLLFMGRRARGMGESGTRWGSSHAGRSRGRSCCCASICLQIRSYISSH